MHVRGRSAEEEELLLRLAKRGFENDSFLSERHLAILMVPGLRNRFFDLAARHYLHGLVLGRLAGLDPSREDLASLREKAHVALRPLQTEALLWDLERDGLIRALGKGGIDPMVLKGAALRLTAYRDSVYRPLGDIDLLVSPDEVSPASRILRQLGYRIPYSDEAVRALEEHHFHFRFAKAPFIVELHWALNKAADPYHLDSASFVRRSFVKVRSGRTDIRVPSSEDLVLHMVAQNLEGPMRFGRLADIDRVIHYAGAFDWDYLTDSARAGGLLTMLAVNLQLCSKLLETPLPPEYVAQLGASRSNLWHLALMRPTTWPFARDPDRPVAFRLKRLWGAADYRGRPDFVRGILTDRQDPLDWVWDEQIAVKRARSLRRGITLFLKLVVYQCWLYIRGAASLLRRSGRRELSFFSE